MTDEEQIAAAAEAAAAGAAAEVVAEQEQENAVEAAEEAAEEAADLAMLANAEAAAARDEAYATRQELDQWQREQTDRIANLETQLAAILGSLETLTAVASQSNSEPEPMAEPEPEPVVVEVEAPADGETETETASGAILSETPPTRKGYLGSVLRSRR